MLLKKSFTSFCIIFIFVFICNSSAFSNDKLLSNQWYIENDGTFSIGTRNIKAEKNIDIGLYDAYKYYFDSGCEVIVAVIDTGIDINHSELRERVWINNGEIPGNNADDDLNGYTDDIYGWNFSDDTNNVFAGYEDDHGTHIAGTIAAKCNNYTGIAGIAQSNNIKVMSLKVLSGNHSSGSIENVIRAIKYAENNGAKVCNLSLATSKNNPELYNTIKESNMLFSVSSGNSGQNLDLSPLYPACYNLPNLISVSNIQCDGALYKKSNFGLNSCHIAAPGVDILSTSSSQGYKYMTGTSMSASMVSAVSALVFSNCGNKVSAEFVKKMILNSCTKISSLKDEIVCGGILSAANVMYNLNIIKSPIKNIRLQSGGIHTIFLN